MQALATAAAARAAGFPSVGQPRRGGVSPLPPLLRGPVSAERPAAFGRPRPALPRPSKRRGGKPAPAGGARALSPARGDGDSPAVGVSPGGRAATLGRRRRVSRRRAALRAAASPLLAPGPQPHFPARPPRPRGGLRRRPAAGPAGKRGEGRRSSGPGRRRRRSALSAGGSLGAGRGAVPWRAAPVARQSPFPVSVRRGGWAAEGRCPSRSPRGSGERGRRPRLSGVRLAPGACQREGVETRSDGWRFRAGSRLRCGGLAGGPAERRAAARRRLGFRRWAVPRPLLSPPGLRRRRRVGVPGGGGEPRESRGFGAPGEKRSRAAAARGAGRRGGARGGGSGAPRCSARAAGSIRLVFPPPIRAEGRAGWGARSGVPPAIRAEAGPSLGAWAASEASKVLVPFRPGSVGSAGSPRALAVRSVCVTLPSFSPCVSVRSSEARRDRPSRAGRRVSPPPRARRGGAWGPVCSGGPPFPRKRGPLLRERSRPLRARGAVPKGRQLLAVDHSARASMKNAASCEN